LKTTKTDLRQNLENNCLLQPALKKQCTRPLKQIYTNKSQH